MARSFSGYYYIQAVHSGKVISIEGPFHNDGAKIHQWDNIGWDNQMWRIEDRGGGYYQIISKYSNKALDVAYQSTADGGRNQQGSWSGAANQKWRLESLGGGFYRIVSQHSGKVLDVQGCQTDNGRNIQQYTWNGGNNQKWYLECVGTGLSAVEAEANRYHLTQYYDVTYNSDGPWGSWNCGPTSLAMNAHALGKMPSGLTQNQRIRYMRSLVSNHVSNYIYINGQSIPQSTMGENGWNVGSDIWQIEDAVAELGGTTGDIWNRSDLDTALAAGRGAILVGYIDGEWRAQFPTTGRYGSGSIGHFLAVLGRTADGRYLVDDPMFTGGSVAMTYEQLSVFADGFYGVNGIWVGF